MIIVVHAALGFVAYVCSWGLFIPEDLNAFRIVAAFSAVAGSRVGQLVAGMLKRNSQKALVIILSLIAAVVCIISYMFMIQVGSADRPYIVLLGFLIVGLFFSSGFLLQIAGRSFGRAPAWFRNLTDRSRGHNTDGDATGP